MDIVERLRNRGIPVQYGEFTDYLPDKDCLEAADEIERLREALERIVEIYEIHVEKYDHVPSNIYLMGKLARSALQQKDSE